MTDRLTRDERMDQDRVDLGRVGDVLQDICHVGRQVRHLTTAHRDDLLLVPAPILIETRRRVQELLEQLDATISPAAQPIRHRRTFDYWVGRLLFRTRF